MFRVPQCRSYGRFPYGTRFFGIVKGPSYIEYDRECQNRVMSHLAFLVSKTDISIRAQEANDMLRDG